MKPVPPVYGAADEVLRAVDEKTIDLQACDPAAPWRREDT